MVQLVDVAVIRGRGIVRAVAVQEMVAVDPTVVNALPLHATEVVHAPNHVVRPQDVVHLGAPGHRGPQPHLNTALDANLQVRGTNETAVVLTDLHTRVSSARDTAGLAREVVIVRQLATTTDLAAQVVTVVDP